MLRSQSSRNSGKKEKQIDVAKTNLAKLLEKPSPEKKDVYVLPQTKMSKESIVPLPIGFNRTSAVRKKPEVVKAKRVFADEVGKQAGKTEEDSLLSGAQSAKKGKVPDSGRKYEEEKEKELRGNKIQNSKNGKINSMYLSDDKLQLKTNNQVQAA